jgi:hypothetical protein
MALLLGNGDEVDGYCPGWMQVKRASEKALGEKFWAGRVPREKVNAGLLRELPTKNPSFLFSHILFGGGITRFRSINQERVPSL